MSATDSEKTFSVNIFTPESRFESGEYSAFTCRGIDGEICIMKNHTPMILAVDFGVLRLTLEDGSTRIAVCSAGFLEVRDNELDAFFDFCRWEEDIESAREEARRLREAEDACGTVRAISAST